MTETLELGHIHGVNQLGMRGHKALRALNIRVRIFSSIFLVGSHFSSSKRGETRHDRLVSKTRRAAMFEANRSGRKTLGNLRQHRITIVESTDD